MANNKTIILVSLLSSIIIVSCKKDKDNPPKDFAAVIKNKTWCGQLTNPGQAAQYYSVFFNADGTLLWTQQAGNYTGTWVLDSTHLTMKFNTPIVQIKADIDDDNTLKYIVSNNTTTVLNGQLTVNPTISLGNTVWKGWLSIAGSQHPFQLDFLSASQLEAKVGSVKYGPYPYTRSVSGAVIQFTLETYPYFGIISSDKEMKGQWGGIIYNYSPWQTTKQ
jgi:hypothetical protein